MKLHEYQSKALLRQYGIPVPDSEVVEGVDAAVVAAANLAEKGYTRFAVKAQVHAGGRGKGGGIKLADSPNEAGELTGAMLGSQLVTPQTGPEGVPIRKVLIEGGADIANELYLGITIDRSKKRPVIIVSTEGGIEIEEVAANEPEKIHNEWIVQRELPKVVRGLVTEDMMRWDDYAQWDDAQHHVDWELHIPAFPNQVKCRGRNAFFADGPDATRVQLTGDLEINLKNIPGVPRMLAGRLRPKIEQFIVKLVTPNLEKVNHSLELYLDATVGRSD